MANFDEMLAALHGDSEGDALSDVVGADKAPRITVTAARTFEIPEDFDKVIAYAGDVNSQIITFVLPELHEGHKLSECGTKKVRWINQSSKVEGTSTLAPTDEQNTYEWNVPPALFTKEGTIEFSIVIYDLDENGRVGFSWNTAICTALSVGKTMEGVSGIEGGPAQNEVLIIDEDSRMIMAPVGYNTTIANSGDVGTSTVYFQTKRYIKGIDLLDHTTETPVIYISYVLADGGKRSAGSESISVEPYTSEYEGITNELVLITWRPEAGLTSNGSLNGVFQTVVSFQQNGKIWNTTPYNGLRIGKPLDSNDNPGGTFAPQLSYKFTGKNYSDNGAAVEIDAIIAHQVHTEAEWRELEYIPEDGEVVYVVDDGVYSGRVGNGRDYVKDLVGSDVIIQGAGKNSAQQRGNIAGTLGYYYSHIDFDNNKIYLALDRVLPVAGAGTLDETFDTPNYAAGEKICIVNGSKYDYGVNGVNASVVNVNHNVLTYQGNLGFDQSKMPTELPADLDIDDYTIFTIEKPLVGKIKVRGNSFATGENTAALGLDSHTEGKDTIAFGNFGHAEGRQTEAGYTAHAEGRGTKAYGNSSHAEGSKTETHGQMSHAEGYETKALKDYSHAEGYQTTADGLDAHAEGRNTQATGARSHAEGEGTLASATAAHAEGIGTEAIYQGAHAEGSRTHATGQDSHAEGRDSTASGVVAHAEGIQSVAAGMGSHAEGSSTVESEATFGHAEGHLTTVKKPHGHAEGSSTTAEGSAAHAEGSGTKASSDAAHAEGKGTIASGYASHAEGADSEATNTGAHAEGTGTLASGANSHAQGSGTTASGPASTAIGVGTTAEGTGSLAFGLNSIASKDGAVAGGNETQAAALYATALGQKTQAKGKYSVALGNGAIASGESSLAVGGINSLTNKATEAQATNSVAIGVGAVAKNSASLAFGLGTVSARDRQVVIGQYNVEDTSNPFVIGWGWNPESPRNIVTISTEGAAWFKTGLKIKGTSWDSGQNVATEIYVNSQVASGVTTSANDATTKANQALADAKTYTDKKITDQNLSQYTTEEEVKNIVDTTITNAVDGDTITGLSNLVQYLHDHGGEAKEMANAITTLEGRADDHDEEDEKLQAQIDTFKTDITKTQNDLITKTGETLKSANNYTDTEIDKFHSLTGAWFTDGLPTTIYYKPIHNDAENSWQVKDTNGNKLSTEEGSPVYDFENLQFVASQSDGAYELVKLYSYSDEWNNTRYTLNPNYTFCLKPGTTVHELSEDIEEDKKFLNGLRMEAKYSESSETRYNYKDQRGALLAGDHVVANGQRSLVAGQYNFVNGDFAGSLGHTNSVRGKNAMAFGYGNIANGHNATALNESNKVLGYGSLGYGDNNVVLGTDSIIGGWQNQLRGNYSFVTGARNIAKGEYIGGFGFNNLYDGMYNFGNGSTNIIKGNYNSTNGYKNTINGSNNTVNGNTNTINSTSNSVFGSNNIIHETTSSANFINGSNNEIIPASSYRSLISGHQNKIVSGGGYNLAVGITNNIHSRFGVALGEGLEVEGYTGAQVVIGRYNVKDTYCQFIVGNGTSAAEKDRKNIFAVQRDGRATLGADPKHAFDAVTKQYADTLVTNLRTEFLKAGNLPTVTTANNGQFLQVVNGVWTAVTIPQAEGGSF